MRWTTKQSVDGWRKCFAFIPTIVGTVDGKDVWLLLDWYESRYEGYGAFENRSLSPSEGEETYRYRYADDYSNSQNRTCTSGS
jgi:hypothetical protein